MVSLCSNIKLVPVYLLKARLFSDLCIVSIIAHHSINNSEAGKDLRTRHTQNRKVRRIQVSLAYGILRRWRLSVASKFCGFYYQGAFG